MGVTSVTVERGRIIVRAPYEYKERLKVIPGARWDADARAWTYPESAAVAQALAWVIGEQPGLNPYLARAAAIEQAATLKDADDLPEIPGLKGESWLHQRQAYWFCMGMFGYNVTDSHSKDTPCSPTSPAHSAEPDSPLTHSQAGHGGTALRSAGSGRTTTPNATPQSPALLAGSAPTNSAIEGTERPTESATDATSTASSPSNYSAESSPPMTSSITRTGITGTTTPQTSNLLTGQTTPGTTSQPTALREEVMPSQSPNHGGGAMLAMAMGTG